MTTPENQLLQNNEELQKKTPLPSIPMTFILPVTLLIVLSIVFGFVAHFTGLGDRFLVASVQLFAVILPTLALYRYYEINVMSAINLRLPYHKLVVYLLVFLFGFMIFSDYVFFWLAENGPEFLAQSIKNTIEIQKQLVTVNDLGGYIWFFLTIVFGAGIFEELLFRGLILKASLRSVKSFTAIILNGMLFATMHFNLAGFVYYTLLGAVLAYVALRTNSLLYGIIIHCALNASALYVAKVYPDLERLPIPGHIAFWGGLAAIIVGITGAVYASDRLMVIRRRKSVTPK